MSNNLHGLTVKENGKTKAHPLYWVWHEKRKNYDMDPAWELVGDFVEWAEAEGWKKGKNIRRYDTHKAYSPANCYVHVRGTALGVLK